jgi:DNA primase
MAIRDDLKEKVQAATDIVRLIGEQVALRPKGREFVGLCPFHDDKSPSMFVNPAKQIYKCFSCGAGGDAFSFQMNYHKMTFPEAIRHLAERAGIAIEDDRSTGAGDGRPSDRKRIAAANEQALGFFRTLLKHPEHGRIARDYIDKRGISPQMVTDFQVGYAPDRWDGLATMVGGKGWDRQAFELAGLLKPRREGNGVYDALRHRLIFPICDSLGRPIAFGGRKLRDEDEPKYLNSPETVLFNKSRTLYGLHLAKKDIIASRTAVIVEGYVDVIACHQAAPGGVRNVVATLGTALTAEHVAELRRYAERVVLIFDADAAGEKAADRAVELFLTGDLDVCIAELPHGPGGAKMDPGEMLFLEEGPDLWLGAISAAKDALEYQFDRVRRQLDAASGVTGRQRVAEEFLTRVGQMGIARSGSLRRALVIQRLAGLLHMGEAQIDGLLKAAAPRTRPPRPLPPPADASAKPISTQGIPPHGQPTTGLAEAFDDGAPIPAPPPGFVDDGGVPMLDDTAEAAAAMGPGSPVDPPAGGGENNVLADVAAPLTGPRLRAVQLAERQLIGCLLKDNALFIETLPQGMAADEALPPEQFTDPANRRLYARVYDRLVAREPATLMGVLADLASEGERELADLVTQCDADAEKLGQDQTTQTLFRQVAQNVMAWREQAEYRLARRRLAGGDGDAAAARATRLLEPLKNRSPIRIARFR